MMKPQRGVTPGKKRPAPRPPRKNNKVTDPVEVLCRIRPIDPKHERCVKATDATSLLVTPVEGSHGLRYGNAKERTYTFKHVFDEYTAQKPLFDFTSLPLVEDVLHGRNALLFAYGVTGSGKTHTMTGTNDEQGVLPRCLDVIFNSIGDLQAKKYVFKPDKMNGFDIQPEVDAMLERQRREIMPKMANTPRRHDRHRSEKAQRIRDMSKVEDVNEDNNYAVFVSYVEIYNNYVYDLLEELPYDPITGNKPPQSKILREDGGHNMYVSGVTEVEVKSTEEAYELLEKGQKRRSIANTVLNTESSRSHSVFNIRLVQAPLDPIGEEILVDKNRIVSSQLSLVDLAGSERMGRTSSKGDRQREAGNINQSLMVLRQCIEALRENQKSGRQDKMVPYRDSKLTLLFKNYFDGEGKVKMIVCVNPKDDEYDEIIQVMKFAELTQEVEVARPQEHRTDIGLAPGRRRMNQRYKEAVNKAKEKGLDPSEVAVTKHLVYSMGPGFPKLELKEPGDEFTLQNLMTYLKERESRRFALMTDLSKKEECFRSRLVNMERENEELKERLSELEAVLAGKDNEVKRVTKRVNSLEKANNALQKTATVYERERRDLEREVDDRDWKIQQEKMTRDRVEQDYRARLVLTEQQMNTQMHIEKQRLVEETQTRLQTKNRKIQMMKHILNADTSDADSVSSASTFATPVRPPRAAPRYATGYRVLPAKSEPDLTNIGGGPTSTPKPHARAKTAHTTNTMNRAVPRTTRGMAPPTKPKPAVNPRYHRRSKSAHEVWLEHKPTGTVETGTLSQPQMKKRKSVSNLREKDTRSGASKYVLTHQEVDSDGDFATKLVKGDIHSTAGGGTAVVFNDVEVIKQRSPGDRKRKSYEQQRPEDYDGDWTDAEDRCRIAIEGHGHMKRVKASAV